jgi:Subtilase family
VDVARGVASVGSGCPIVPIRLGDTPSSGRVATALAWARQQQPPLRVVSMSLTVVETSVVVSELNAAWQADMVLCAATGNMPPDYGARSVGFPARHLYVIGVGASDEDDHRCEKPRPGDENWQSRYGDGVDVVAPGVRIWTTDERQGTATGGFNPPPANWARGANGEPLWFGGTTDDGVGFGPDPEYLAVFSGTSAATPHVAGLASLILACRQDLSAEGVRNLIERTCDMRDDYAGDLRAHPKRIPSASNPLPWNAEVGCGRINAAAALAEIEADPDLPAIPLHPDPCEGTERVVLVGYVGRGPGTKWRVYATANLDRWTEVAEADILDSDQLPLGGSLVYVRPGAEIRRVIVSYLGAGSGFIPG